jgi:hypothetical protein
MAARWMLCQSLARLVAGWRVSGAAVVPGLIMEYPAITAATNAQTVRKRLVQIDIAS